MKRIPLLRTFLAPLASIRAQRSRGRPDIPPRNGPDPVREVSYPRLVDVFVLRNVYRTHSPFNSLRDFGGGDGVGRGLEIVGFLFQILIQFKPLSHDGFSLYLEKVFSSQQADNAYQEQDMSILR